VRRIGTTALLVAVFGVMLFTAPAQASTGYHFESPANGSTVPAGWHGPVEVKVFFSRTDVGRGFYLYYPNGDYDRFVIRADWRSPHLVRATGWPMRGLSPGRYTINVNRDLDEGGRTAAHTTFTVKRFAIGTFRASPRTIYSTVRDGYLDCARISWYQSLPGTMSLEIRGHGVRTIGSRRAGSNSFSWCGTSASGARLEPGSYALRIRGRDASGVANDVSAYTSVRVATKLVRISNTAYRDGVQFASRGWKATAAGGKCNWASYSGSVLSTCLYAVAHVMYRFQLPAGATFDGMRFGYTPSSIVACHPSGYYDVQGRTVLGLLVSDGSNGWSQCYFNWVQLKFHKLVRK
jgi:hypothetical protein